MSATLRGRTPLRHSGHVSLLARARPSSSTIVLPSFYLLLPSRGASLSAPCPPLLLHFSHGILFTHRLLALSCPTYCRLQHLTPSSFLLCPSEPQTTPWSPCPLFVSQVQRKHGSGHKVSIIPNLNIVYSRGQAKPTNKNGNVLMATKVPGKRADMLREASGQISAKSHKPFWRKWPYTEIDPKILAGHQKVPRKI